MEEKANRKLAEAEALEEMGNAAQGDEDLKEKYSSIDMDDALAKLREEIK